MVGGALLVVVGAGDGEGEAEEDPPAGTIVPLVGGEEELVEAGRWSATARGSAGLPPLTQVDTPIASNTTSSTELPSAIARRRR
ncbi:hypothetical protein GCM10010174_23160 [Kutzneria viridogrisea]